MRMSSSYILHIFSPVFIFLITVSPSSSSVLPLTTSNFTVPNGSSSQLTFFYAPWCGHCNKLHPVYEALEESYEAPGVPNTEKVKSLIFTKVDAEKEGEGDDR